VTVTDTAQTVVGATCANKAIGLFAERNGTWVLVGPLLPRGLDAGPTTVLRLVTTGSGVAAVVAAVAGGRTNLVATWSVDGTGSWRVSPALVIGATDRIVSIGVGPGGVVAVDTAGAHGSVLSEVAPASAGWGDLSTAPPGTETVVADPDGAVEAMSVHDSRLVDWVLATPRGAWTKTQTIDVPIQYGSSS
jgi:hypothetical protein